MVMVMVMVMFPSVALACPACAGRVADDRTLYLLGAMLVLPFAIALAAGGYLRKLEKRPHP